MRYLITILLLCCAVLVGCSRKDTTADALQWHPSEITCPNDKWTPQNGYILSRIELGNGREECTDAITVVATPAQSAKPHEIDWKDCEQVAKKLEPEVTRFNVKHSKAGDGLQIQAGCTYSQPEPKKPQRKIALTKQEASSLRELRRVANRILTTESKYEDGLIKAHGVEKPDYGDPCWHFVGIIFNEYSITIDPNTSMPGCN